MNDKPCILIVDDVAVNVTLITCIFKKRPYTVLTAYSGEEALEILANNHVDLVLLDIMMPGIDGYEVLSQIRSKEATKDLPVIMLSALNMHEDVDKALEMGANDFISKPVVMPKLLAAVQKFL